MAGLTETGFEVDTIDDIVDGISQDIKDTIDPNIDTTATSVMGQLAGIFGERVEQLQQMARDVWAAFTPGGASGFSLSQLALITGTKKKSRTKSEVPVTVNLDAGTTLPAGSSANVLGSPKSVFETLEDITNTGGSPANFTITMRAVTAGAVRANAGTLTQITSAVSGWNSVTNATDAEIGLEDEKDQDLRERRESEIRQEGSGALDAIQADVGNVAGVLDVTAFENADDDVFSLWAPHSFLIVVWDGDPNQADNSAIAQAIWNAKPVGIKPLGSVVANAVDKKGITRVMRFDRATQIDIYFEIDLTKDDTYPADGDDQVKTAITAYADSKWKIGSDVVLSALYGSIFAISGVVSVDAIRAGLTVSPSGTSNIAISDSEIAIADTSRIVVTST